MNLDWLIGVASSDMPLPSLTGFIAESMWAEPLNSNLSVVRKVLISVAFLLVACTWICLASDATN